MGATCDCCETKPTNEHTIEAPNSRSAKVNPVAKELSITYSNSNNMSSINSKEAELIEGNLTDDFITTIEEGNVTMFKQYVQQYPSKDLINKRLNNPHYDGDRCLDIAIKNKQYEIMICILKYGTSVNKQHKITGDTALHLAGKQGDLKTLKILGAFGVDKNILNKDGDKAIDIAIDADESMDYVYAPICDELQQPQYAKMTTHEVMIAKATSLLHAPSTKGAQVAYDADSVDIFSSSDDEIVGVTQRVDVITDHLLDDIGNTMRTNKHDLVCVSVCLCVYTYRRLFLCLWIDYPPRLAEQEERESAILIFEAMGFAERWMVALE